MATMTPLLKPFTGYVPAAEFAHRIVGPPVSTLSPHQREIAQDDPLSFRHVVGKGAGSSYEEAHAWMQNCLAEGALVPVGPAVFVHRITRRDFAATGIVADVSLAGYKDGLVKRHETTIAKTEKKMASYMRTTRIYGNPVALAHAPHAAIDTAIATHTKREPDHSFVAADGVAHALWAIDGDEAQRLCESYTDALYITDGHHRLAAAALVADEEGRHDAHFPAALFSARELRLRSFARGVVDPDIDVDDVIRRLGKEHRLEEVREGAARPRDRFEFGAKIAGRSFLLHLDRRQVPDDLYRRLDVNLLQDLILGPIFGIEDPRNDDRLHFLPDTVDPPWRRDDV